VSAPLIALIILIFMLCGMVLGSYLRLVLSEHHTQTDIYLILELNDPLEGTIKVSSTPLHKALALIGT